MFEQTQALRQLLSAKYICKSERIIPRREDGKEFWMKVCENLASDTAANTNPSGPVWKQHKAQRFSFFSTGVAALACLRG